MSRYDLATPQELLYHRLLAPSIAGHDISRWKVLVDLEATLGTWIEPYVDADKISSTITEAFPVGGQTAVLEIEELVGECAKILGVAEPSVFLRNDSRTVCYTTEVDGRPMLTLTSGLLRLYEQRPEELRFVVGRELGRIKCGHEADRVKMVAIFTALQMVDIQVIPDEYQLVLPTLALGRLMSLLRETDFTADRAGLLCCQDLQVAYQAMLRQLHGLGADSSWIDPTASDFDPQAYLQEMHYWEQRPLVEFLQSAKRQSSASPFVAERLAQLAVWSESGACEKILDRDTPDAGPDLNQLVTVDSVTLRNIGDDGAVSAYIRAYVDHDRWFRTTTAPGFSSARWPGISLTKHLIDGQPIFFEVWSDGWAYDTLLGGFVIYPRRDSTQEDDEAVFQTSVNWDWNRRSATSRQGTASVTVRFSTRAENQK